MTKDGAASSPRSTSLAYQFGVVVRRNASLKDTAAEQGHDCRQVQSALLDLKIGRVGYPGFVWLTRLAVGLE